MSNVTPVAETPPPGAPGAPPRGPEPGDDGSWAPPTIDGIRWVPMYDAIETKNYVSRWSLMGYGLAAATLVAGLVLGIASDVDEAALVGVIGAVVAGLLLVCIGIGLLAGESLRAESVPAISDSAESVAGVRMFTVNDISKIGEVFVKGLSGLTAPRAAIFAGAFLLAIAAIGGGITATGDGDDGSGPGSTPTPTASTSVVPTPT